MALIPRWRKLLRIAALAVAMIVVVAAVCVQIQQRVLRWRAERLLGDIRGLQLGKSTWADAQRIMTRWGAWGFYEGSCTHVRCSYQIAMEDVYQGFPIYSTPSNTMRKGWRGSGYWMLFPYEILGGRPTLVSARFEVIDGVIWAKDYRIGLQATAGVLPGDLDYVLSASASTVWRSADFRGSPVPAHPEYIISRPGGCLSCVVGYSNFTPYADASVVRGLMDFKLDCLTRVFSCRDQMDLMPTAWKQFEIEEKEAQATNSESRDGPNPCWSSAEFQGRDRRSVVIAEVVDTRTEQDFSGSHKVASFRLRQRMKRGEFWNPSEIGEATLPSYLVNKAHPEEGFVLPGRRVILTIGPQYDAMPKWIDLDPCDALPATDQNLASIRRGIRRDIFPSDNRRWP